MKTLKRWKHDSMRFVIYEIIVFKNLRFRPYARKRISRRFQKSPLTPEGVLNRCLFGDRFQRIRVDGRPNRRKTLRFQTVTDRRRRGRGDSRDRFCVPKLVNEQLAFKIKMKNEEWKTGSGERGTGNGKLKNCNKAENWKRRYWWGIQ